MRQRALLLLVGLWMAQGALAAQAHEAQTEVILEAHLRGYGMTGFAGEHLYLRVRGNGETQFGNPQDRSRPDILRTSKLPRRQLQSFVAFLSSPGVRSLATVFPTPGQMIDSDETLTVAISVGHEPPQKVEIHNYLPPATKNEVFYPPALSELMCRMETLRVHASARLVPKEWCKPTPQRRR